ncbi:TPA: ABC transporter ATP-binding protein [Legionella pneumophila]|uniref:ABC transporter ATP-binding protein n=1 Tax=Legionella pneumophila TaxID=446 RepID=UPI0007708AFD|nr:ABC transporter ATP-binding protein [Legionella pneumophila]CZG71343.1 Macrolide export ATP-binding/permease protein MacB [Legionella pneumophila]CZH93537.1 Macrolide export ATP-binding/permease protein MacB [Legionella pneumophila]HAT1720484.1 ABC transporter ATP-binding protein [Legionella pneumophila]HAT8613183.1 ATP-binding cassette domain-containing protein [Legionella pneumophila]HDO7804726.1 ABC transporter ATP-binding protein [Legionella pneumophila]
MSPIPAFVIRNLTKTYLMGEVVIHALRCINLDLYQGELVVFLGPSGSGKSTLLNIIGGLDVPSSGEVIYKDHLITSASQHDLTRYRREHIGFVFQFYNLISNLTALENVSIVTEIAENPMHPEDAIKLLGLEHRMHHFPAQLSGGEQQRVAIARAIAKNPDVLLCDEPTGALDCETGKIVLAALALANQKLKTTVVIITHNIVISEMADRVIHIADGVISNISKNKFKRKPEELEW